MRLNQVTVAVHDLDAATAFYQRLGLTQIVDNPPSYARFECLDGGSTFSLHADAGAATGETVLYFECDDVDAEVARLQEQGIAFEQLPTDEPWLWREARLSDPSGNRLCLYHAGSNRRFPPWRLDGRNA